MIAELHKKLSSELTNSEDLLTGIFFGTLRYTNLCLTLPYILKKSYFEKDKHRKILNDALKEVRNDLDPFKFWPLYKSDEIDLIIELQKYVIGIEVKYHSGLSSDDLVRLDQGDPEIVSCHQLARYSKMLINKYPKHQKILIYLAKESQARSVYKDTLNRNLINCEKISFGVLSWQNIYAAIEELKDIVIEKDKLIINDLSNYLYKKGFDRFKNFEIKNINKVENNKYFYFQYSHKFSFNFQEPKKIGELYYEYK